MRSNKFGILAFLFLVFFASAVFADYDYSSISIYANNNVYSPGDTIQLSAYAYPGQETPFTLSIYKYDDNIPRLFQKSDEKILAYEYCYNYTDMVFPKQECYNNTQYNKNLSLPIGEYLIYAQTTSGANSSYDIQVTNLGIVAKTSPNSDSATIIVVNKTSGSPVEGAAVSLYLVSESYSTTGSEHFENLVSSGTTDASGIVQLKEPRGYSKATASVGGDSAFVNFYSYSPSDPYSAQYTVYGYTDRPIYRPGQTVHYRAIIWKQLNDSSYEDANGTVEIELSGPTYNNVVNKTAELQDGIVSVDFPLDSEAALGYYSISINYQNGSASTYDSFQVQDYQKPEYQVTLTPKKDWFNVEDQVEVDVNAQYFFGKPVKNATISFEAMQGYRYWPCEYWACPVYATGNYASDAVRFSGGFQAPGYGGSIYPYYGYYGPEIANGTITTDENGTAKISFLAPSYGQDYNIIIQTATVDSAGKRSEDQVEVPVSRGFTVNIDTGWSAEISKPADIKISTSLFNGSEVDATGKVSVRYYEYNYSSDTQQNITEYTGTFATKNGEYDFNFTPNETGAYEIYVEADSNGYHLSQSGYLWAWGGVSYYNFDSLDLKSQNDTYADGETAEMFVVSPSPDATVYVSIEDGKIYSITPHKLNGTSLEFGIPINRTLPEKFSINVFLAYNGSAYTASKVLEIKRDDHELNLSISTQKESGIFAPNENLSLAITASTKDGAPKKTIVSLGVVDASIYELAPDYRQPIYSSFYEKPFQYNTQTSFSWGSGGYRSTGGIPPQAEGATSGGTLSNGAPSKSAGAIAPSAPNFAQIQVRKNFPDTAYWNPFIVIDDSGKGTLEFELPDSLTTWNLSAVATSTSMDVGEASASIIAQKPVIATISSPTFLTERDRAQMLGIIHNYADSEQTFNVLFNATSQIQLENTNGAASGSSGKNSYMTSVTIPANGEADLNFWVQAKGCCSANVSLYAVSNSNSSLSDAMQLTLPIAPHGIEVTNLSTSSDDLVEQTYELPASSFAKAQLTISPTIASTALEGLDYLVDYPYGCVEQTMSRFMPAVVVKKTVNSFGLSLSAETEAKLPDVIDQSLQRLYDFQQSDGGWGWWGSDQQSNPEMTAYVVYGLSLAKENGVDVNQQVLDKGIAKLEEFANEDNSSVLPLDESAYVVFAHAYATKSMPGGIQMQILKDNYMNLSDRGLALYVRAQQESGVSSPIGLDELISRATCTQTMCKWNGYSYEYNDVEATSHATLALMKAGKKDEAQKAINWLVSRRTNTMAWDSTRDSAAALLAISEYLKSTGELSPDYSVKVLIDDVPTTGEISFSGKNLTPVTIQLPTKGSHTVSIRKTGTGTMYSLLSTTYFTNEESIGYESSGNFSISRSYNASSIMAGDLAQVTLNITPFDSDYLVIEEPIPAGTEVVPDSVRMPYWGSRYEIRDDKLVIFVDHLYYSWWYDELGNEQNFALTYQLRGTYEGTFHVMPAKISQMYLPEVQASSGEDIFNVAGRAAVSIQPIELPGGIMRVNAFIDSPESFQGTLQVSALDSSGKVLAEKSVQVSAGGAGVTATVDFNGISAPATYSYNLTSASFAESGEVVASKAKAEEPAAIIQEVPSRDTTLLLLGGVLLIGLLLAYRTFRNPEQQ